MRTVDNQPPSRAELLAKAARLRRLGGRAAASKPRGQPIALDTAAGPVRALAYGGGEGPQPVFFDLHGGGFILGHPEMDDPFLPHLAAAAKLRVISLDYPLAPEHPFPAALDAIGAAIAAVMARAGELGVDPARAAIGGHSAGGNLAAAACLRQAGGGDWPLRAAVLDYPALDLLTDPDDKPRGRGLVARWFLTPDNLRLFNDCYCPDPARRADPLVSPLYAAAGDLAAFPPALILTAGQDALAAEAEAFGGRLEAAGRPVQRVRFDSAVHGFTLAHTRAARQAWDLMAAFLRQQLAL
ncbi:MAG: alpha/beta hydrolase [Bifidobacteriaceae bacterium]|jgi:acetyl esterase|nr:alpha/beta hydrolase [Bifidobacteriaceae bacterium]